MSKPLVEELRERLLDENYHLAKLCRDHADEIERALNDSAAWREQEDHYLREITRYRNIIALHDSALAKNAALAVELEESIDTSGYSWVAMPKDFARRVVAALKGEA